MTSTNLPLSKASIRSAGFKLAAAVGILAVASSAASAANQCAAIKSAISQKGSYVYHYRDPAHPSLDLYERYVSSPLQCGGGYAQQMKAVASLVDCAVPTCVKVYGDGNL